MKPLPLVWFGALALAACSQSTPETPAAAKPAPAPAASAAKTAGVAARAKARPAFTPPAEADLPAGPLGEEIRLGRAIFTDTPEHARDYVGNGLSCSNCHLDAGRLANSAPLWGAWGMYPQYRKKNGHVNSFGERLQGCFRFSMNGKAPPLDSDVIVALESYAWWMSKGAPNGVKLAGAGYPKENFKPPQPPDYARGAAVYAKDCALCHGADGQGQQVAGRNVFPPLWGPQSFNWGAGMHQLDNAAAFIKANMPLSRGGTLSDQDAWDVAMYMDAHERPQDPRYAGDVAATRVRYHDTAMSLYGTVVNGHLLGSGAAK
ncbi:c-type cytochrome [Rhodanobacter geophilus]|uniref:C-type cytochrome n=1 Tax=Rhodanobacter geophilus TaxID=3162488 RepID=A0ABV3QK95_9GAMM